MKNAILVSGCPGEEGGWNTQLLYFTGSSLSRDDKSLFLISDRDGSPNVIVRDLATGTERTLTQNRNGVMKSYVYFDCNPGKGLSKASVCLGQDAHPHPIYSHDGRKIFFNSRSGRYVKVYCVDARP